MAQMRVQGITPPISVDTFRPAGVNCLNDVTALGGRLIAPRSWYYTHGLRTRRRLLALMPLLPPPGLEARARQCRLRGGGDEGRVAHCSIPYFVLHYLNYILYHSTCDSG